VRASVQLKRDLIAQMRIIAAGRELDVSPAQVALDFMGELPSEYEGCQSVYVARVVRVVGGQVVVLAESSDDETTCDESDLLTQSVETVEALAEAVNAAATGT
jgi:hypothetical protein